MNVFKSILLIILINSIQLFGQELSVIDFKCENLKKIDRLEFEQNRIIFSQIVKSKSVSKRNETLTIKTKDSTLIFKDNFSDTSFFEHTYLGEFPEHNWTLILGQDYQQNYYYLINMVTSRIDTLVGFPHIFKNKILSIEEPYTDGSALIEIWKIENTQITKSTTFSAKKCFVYGVQESYLNGDIIYLKNAYNSTKYDYYKLKINL